MGTDVATAVLKNRNCLLKKLKTAKKKKITERSCVYKGPQNPN